MVRNVYGTKSLWYEKSGSPTEYNRFRPFTSLHNDNEKCTHIINSKVDLD